MKSVVVEAVRDTMCEMKRSYDWVADWKHTIDNAYYLYIINLRRMCRKIKKPLSP